jgi:Kef-type K+ transport system membrane component KefB
MQCGLVCVIAFVGKLGGAYLAARGSGETHRHALAIGVCMNTRALMELIALNIGYDLGVLPRQMYTMLVIMALVSTYMATPLIRWLMRNERAPEAPEEAVAAST